MAAAVGSRWLRDAGACTDCVNVLSEGALLPAEPESGYGWAKLSGELLGHSLLGDRFRVVRLHNVYGPGIALSRPQVVPDLVVKALRRRRCDPDSDAVQVCPVVVSCGRVCDRLADVSRCRGGLCPVVRRAGCEIA